MRKTHLKGPSIFPPSATYDTALTACGLTRSQVKMAENIYAVTCLRCRQYQFGTKHMDPLVFTPVKRDLFNECLGIETIMEHRNQPDMHFEIARIPWLGSERWRAYRVMRQDENIGGFDGFYCVGSQDYPTKVDAIIDCARFLGVDLKPSWEPSVKGLRRALPYREALQTLHERRHSGRRGKCGADNR